MFDTITIRPQTTSARPFRIDTEPATARSVHRGRKLGTSENIKTTHSFFARLSNYTCSLGNKIRPGSARRSTGPSQLLPSERKHCEDFLVTMNKVEFDIRNKYAGAFREVLLLSRKRAADRDCTKRTGSFARETARVRTGFDAIMGTLNQAFYSQNDIDFHVDFHNARAHGQSVPNALWSAYRTTPNFDPRVPYSRECAQYMSRYINETEALLADRTGLTAP